MKNIDKNSLYLYIIPALFIRTNKSVKYIPFEQILYLKAEGSYTTVVLCDQDKKYLSSLTLGQIEQKMNCPFILRLHRSYMVNLKQVTGIVGNAVRVGKEIIPIGRSYKHIKNSFIII